MVTYQIEMASNTSVRLIKDDGKGAAGSFDGGHIYYAPESFPAEIHRHQRDAVMVGNEAEWADFSAAYVAGRD